MKRGNPVFSAGSAICYYITHAGLDVPAVPRNFRRWRNRIVRIRRLFFFPESGCKRSMFRYYKCIYGLIRHLLLAAVPSGKFIAFAGICPHRRPAAFDCFKAFVCRPSLFCRYGNLHFFRRNFKACNGMRRKRGAKSLPVGGHMVFCHVYERRVCNCIFILHAF